MKLRTNRTAMTAFSAISLTDIVFLLLIFFLLSSTFILQPGIKVSLPRTTQTEVSAEKSIVVSITADGTLYINEKRVSKALFPAQMRQRLLSVGKPIVAIRADKRITLDRAVEVMDLCRVAGAEKFVIVTRQVEL